MAASDSAFHSRAVRSIAFSFENDPDPMVHQQLARLLFLSEIVELKNKRVLEFGCGSGLNCSFLRDELGAEPVVGFDISHDSISLAKEQHSNLNVFRADACDEALEISPGTWDFIVSFEVLEHVRDMVTFMRNVHRHMAPGGAAFITTPNRDVFSLGHEPSPMNREHLKELSFEEFENLVRPFFPQIEIWGQRFRRKDLQESWNDDVRNKINQLRTGTRWQHEPSLRERLRSIPIVNTAYQNKSLRKSWKFLRWNLWYTLEQKRKIKNRPYTYADFEFSKDLSDALWICALIKV